ncbi:MAG: hypothetical protein GX962_11535 [Epulopiscium sp.]|nr:hypothetical protein [Candidatus Epulonipiscium sp.]
MFKGFQWKKEDNGFIYCGCNGETRRINFNGLKLNVRPYAMGWTPEVLPSLQESWLEICLLFESDQIVLNYQDRVIKQEAQNVILNLMSIFSCTFFETGIFFTDEIMDGIPWECLMGERVDLWAFDAEIVREDMEDIYSPMNCDFLKIKKDNKTYIFNKNTMNVWDKLICL